jgi:hypothetical protein
VPLALVNSKLVVVAEAKKALVEVRLVKTPVLGVVAPIEELLIGELVMVPPLIVKALVTKASVIESAGKKSEPVTERLVEVTLVEDKLAIVPFVEVTIVPDAEVKIRGPDKVPPESGK